MPSVLSFLLQPELVSQKFCTHLQKGGQTHVPQAFLVPICAPWDCLVSPSVICLAHYHLFFSWILFVIPFFILFSDGHHSTFTRTQSFHLSDKERFKSLALSRLKCLTSHFIFHELLPVLRNATCLMNPL